MGINNIDIFILTITSLVAQGICQLGEVGGGIYD